MGKKKKIILWLFLIILLELLIFWGYNIYVSSAIFIPLPNNQEIFIPLPFGLWHELDKLDFVNEAHKDIEILSDSPEMIDKIKDLLSVNNSFENVNRIYYTNRLGLCDGEGRFVEGKVYVTDCNVPMFVGDFIVVPTNWLPLVLYHEIGHHVLQIKKQESLINDFAVELMKKKGLTEPQRRIGD